MRNTYFQGYRATGRYSDFASFGCIRRATAGADLALLHAALDGSGESERSDSKRIQRGNTPSALRFLVERRILTSIPLSRAAPCRPTGACPAQPINANGLILSSGAQLLRRVVRRWPIRFPRSILHPRRRATIPQQPTEAAMSRLHGADVLRILRASLVPAHLCDGPTFLHEGALEAGETEIRARWHESREAGCEHPPFEVGSSSGGGGAFFMPSYKRFCLIIASQ